MNTMFLVDLSNINSKITSTFSSKIIVNAIGWLVFALFLIGAAGFGFWWYLDKKKFNKKIKVYEIINGYYTNTYNDLAKSVKLGKGGFEVVYLKKLKTWKLAHGARTGKNEYVFFIQPDGYWYPGQILADVTVMDEKKGLISVVTTNPLMRGQYTSLEKQIDSLHGDKQSFWDKYGNWVLSIAFILIIGVLAWLIFKEMSPLMGQFTALTEQMTKLTAEMSRLAGNLNNANGGGLVPAS